MTAANLVIHAKTRAKQRYGKSLNRQSYYELIARIKHNQSRCVRKISNSRSVHEVDGMFVVYSKRAGKIVTFLPADCWEGKEER